VLLTATIAGLATSRALRPVSVITNMAHAVGGGDVSQRVPVPDTDDEIEHLAGTVNEMLDRIAAGRTAQRQFTSDAAHELRTPLMALQGEIELAMRSPSDVDAVFLTRIDSLTKRLAHRVDDLVLLSTLDEQPPLRLDTIDVLEVVNAEAAAMPAGPSSPEIEIVGAPLVARIDERLLARAVRNLMLQTGATLQDAAAMASSVPARFMNVADKTGAIAAGRRADLILVDDDLNVLRTWIGGREISAA
jgi:signal transduction histidine kinase